MNEKKELKIIRELCNRLNTDGISYCHWKSNNALDRSASGENDLDLLVSGADTNAFIGILSQLGFKQAFEGWRPPIPGISDYYGFDRDTGSLIHVHAHYKLILGHDATKNYHIPIEEPYLASSTIDGLFKIPAAEFELIILIIRLMVKHSTWIALLLGEGRLSPSERNELVYLWKLSSEAQVYEILKQYLPFINQDIFSACFRLLATNRPVWERVKTANKLMNCLKPYLRYPQIIDSGIKIWQRFTWPIKIRIFRTSDGKKMFTGGKVVAVVGGDGAGKTTTVEEIYNWLSEDFITKRFHMGKPKWSLMTVLIRGILKIGRIFGLYPFMKAEIQYTNETDLLVFPGYPWLIREICTARDRYLTYIKAFRFATNGGIVVLDRYPIPQIKLMDSPYIARMTTNIQVSKLLKIFINWEESYYQKMILPDLLVLLRANPEVAVLRKKDEEAQSVRARSKEIWDMDWKDTPVSVIDANLSKEEVLLEVKELLWTRL